MTAARIALLGRVGIEHEGRPAGRGLPGRRAELVFAYLAAEHGRTVSRDALADALWPYALPDTWAAALRGVVTEVRRCLEDGGLDPGEVLVSANGGYELRLPPGVAVDVDEARAAYRSARELAADDAPAEAAAMAERAASLARHPFLPQHDGEWVDGVREELAALHTRALELQVRAHAQAGDRDGAADAAERLVRAEPYGEAGHQLRIRVLGELGDRAGAAAAFEHHRAMLAAELGTRPSPETEAVLREALARAPATGGVESGGTGPPENGLPALSVLVVSAQEFQRRTAAGILRGLGAEDVAEVSDGAAALERIARGRAPDVIVCDLELPGIDGVELLRQLAERDVASALILTTALDPGVVAAVETLAEAYGVALLGVVEKPVTGRRLAELLAVHRRREASTAVDPGGAPPTAGDIAAALGAGRLGARFRPLADLASGRVTAVTALPGWEAATGGWAAAATVPGTLDGADGLARRLAEHTLALACELAASSRAEGHGLAVAVPLAARALEDAGLADGLAAVARDHGVEPRVLVCNVGEHVLRRDPRALATLARLRIRGFGVVLERFSADTAGAEQLARMPLTGVKVAPDAMAGAVARPDRAAALEEALELARAVRLPAAAAGCDGPGDLELLLRLGCRYAEGDLIAGPRPAAGLAGWAAGWRPPPAPADGQAGAAAERGL